MAAIAAVPRRARDDREGLTCADRRHSSPKNNVQQLRCHPELVEGQPQWPRLRRSLDELGMTGRDSLAPIGATVRQRTTSNNFGVTLSLSKGSLNGRDCGGPSTSSG